MSIYMCQNQGVSNEKQCLFHRWHHPSNIPGTSQIKVIVSFSAATTNREPVLRLSSICQAYSSVLTACYSQVSFFPKEFFKKLRYLRNRASQAIFVETRGLLRGFELWLTDRFPFIIFFFFVNFLDLNVINHRFGQMGSKT